MPDRQDTPQSQRYSRRQIAALAALIAAGGTASVVLRQNQRLGVDIGDEPMVRLIHSDAISPRLDPGQSDISLAVFSDYRCPVCRKSDEALMAVTKRDGKVRVLFKEWPIFGELSEQAAIVALMADRQHAYLQVHQALLRAPTLDTDAFRRVVEGAGAAWAPVERELSKPGQRTLEQLKTARNEAFALGLSGTPGYLTGRILVKGALSENELEDVLALAREIDSGA